MILTDIIVRPLFCPYYTTSAKYGTNWVLLRKSVVLLAEIIFESKRNVNLLGSSRGGAVTEGD